MVKSGKPDFTMRSASQSNTSFNSPPFLGSIRGYQTQQHPALALTLQNEVLYDEMNSLLRTNHRA